VTRKLVCLGEGVSDCDSLPTLVLRVAAHFEMVAPIVLEPIRFKRDRLRKHGELNRLLGLARAKLRGQGAILILLDAEEDGCPAKIGPDILRDAREICSDLPLAVVVAKPMFETWIVAGAEGLIEEHEIHPGPVPPAPEDNPKNPKRWLSERIRRSDGYAETADLQRLTGRFSIADARRRCASFDKLCRELAGLLGTP
jgi:hypothetical protein